MGALGDLASEKGFRSLRALALAISAGGEHNQEYVANKVRDLDRGLDLEWWTVTGRPYWIKLMDELVLDESDLVAIVQRGASEGGSAATNLWVFGMFPGLRPLDLKSEELFPGVPSELTREGGPASAWTWWVAPPGAGKTVLGRWLEVRFGWTFVREPSWTAALRQLPKAGRVYLELDDWRDAPVDPGKVVPADVRLCVAAPGGPPLPDEPPARGRRMLRSKLEQLVDESPWQVVHSGPPDEWLTQLAHWSASRLPRPDGFVLAEVLDLLADPSVAALINTPGEALDLFGVIDQVGQATPLRWAKAWLQAAARREDRQIPPGMSEHLRRDGLDVLLAATKARMTQGLAGTTLSRHRWEALLPTTSAAPDFAQLAALASREAPDALEAIRQLLRPDAAAWATAFERVRVLREVRGGLEVHPEWLGRVLEQQVGDGLAADVPEGLGTLLLHPDTAEATLDRLVQDVIAGNLKRIRAAAGSLDPCSPEQLAYLDGAVRAVGVALGAGADVPFELVESLWSRALALREPDPPLPDRPMLMVGVSDWDRGMTTLGTWYLSMLTISRVLTRTGAALTPSALNPWSGPISDDERERLLAALRRAEGVAHAAPARDAATALVEAYWRLGRDLFDQLGVLAHEESVVECQVPHVLIALSRGEKHDLSDELRRQVLGLSCGLRALERACAWSEIPLGNVLTWCWRSWVEAQGTLPHILQGTGSRWGSQEDDAPRILWEHLPADSVNQEVCRILTQVPQMWPVVSTAVWERWVEVWAADANRWSRANEVFEALPEAVAVEALRSGAIDRWSSGIRRILWRRMPERLSEVIDELAAAEPNADVDAEEAMRPLEYLVWSAPEEATQSLVERAAQWTGDPERFPGVGEWVWQWLKSVADRRRPGWREAFGLVVARRGVGVGDGGAGR